MYFFCSSVAQLCCSRLILTGDNSTPFTLCKKKTSSASGWAHWNARSAARPIRSATSWRSVTSRLEETRQKQVRENDRLARWGKCGSAQYKLYRAEITGPFAWCRRADTSDTEAILFKWLWNLICLPACFDTNWTVSIKRYEIDVFLWHKWYLPQSSI